ncbi:TatD DNase family protein [Seinonella peptonophila]|uniref:TatD DNase family protein n=1 Tax=Seinonella peptonophila TaxID=112248 RepID=A0A1M4YLW8_9BACL|nr:TatD family hydrolase [Seinonella peptonophila]SHF06627.1 TatD DNase family protein [Seinonella peptonophila]
MLFDSHAHMNDQAFAKDQKEVLKRAQEQYGVRYLLNIGYNRETIQSTLALVDDYDFIYAAIGWHPHDAKDCSVEEYQWMKAQLHHPKVVAIGEIGLDYYWDNSPRDVQHRLFRRQIQLAREVGLPIVIHDRDAHDDTVAILREEQAEQVGGVMHCFSGDLAMMEACLSFNFHIGLGGPVTFKNGHLAKEVAKHVPLDRLLIETDAPYLAPHPYRGKRNETGYVRLVAEEIANLRGVSYEELAQVTMENAKRLFRIDIS